jgi:lipid A 4'-phosphatase
MNAASTDDASMTDSESRRKSLADASPAGRHTAILWLWLPLAALVALTVLCRVTAVDLVVSGWFYGGPKARWPYANVRQYPVFDLLYRFGTWPGVALGVGGLLVGLLSYVRGPLRRWRTTGLALAAMLTLGPGLMVNLVTKNWFQRPRPRHIVQFGGSQEFVPVGKRAPADTPESVGRSFPSGHAATGFFLMAPAFLLSRRHPRWAVACLLLGCGWGAGLGLVRVVQGDHFVSDVLWAGGLVYMSGLMVRGLVAATCGNPARLQGLGIQGWASCGDT